MHSVLKDTGQTFAAVAHQRIKATETKQHRRLPNEHHLRR